MWTKVDLVEDGVLDAGKPEQVFLFDFGLEVAKVYQQPEDGLWVGVVVNGDWEVQFSTGPVDSAVRARMRLAMWLNDQAVTWLGQIVRAGAMDDGV
jgi:hypothetical protein